MTSEEKKTPPQVYLEKRNSPRFDIRTEEGVLRMLEYLDEYGYVVVASVCSQSEVETARVDFWDFTEKVTAPIPGVVPIRRDNPSSWHCDNWLADIQHGIHNARGFNHSDFLWKARLLPDVKKAFASIWHTDDLIVSYDAGNVFRPWQYEPTWITEGGWWHVDQNSLRGKNRQGKVCVQGFVTYYDATEDTGGLCVIPGSHLLHDAICERTDFAKSKIDFVPLTKEDPLLVAAANYTSSVANNESSTSNSSNIDAVRDVIDGADGAAAGYERDSNGTIIPRGVLICCKAGDLVLWDSRTVHCNTPGISTAAKAASAAKKQHFANGGLHPTSPKLPIVTDEKSIASESDRNASAADTKGSLEGIDTSTKSEVITSDAATESTETVTTQPTVDLIRLCAYVCMVPRNFASLLDIESRKLGHLNRTPTTHWPAQRVEHWYKSQTQVDLKTCSRERLQLVGYTYWDSIFEPDIRSAFNEKQSQPSNGSDNGSSKTTGCIVM